VSEFVQVGLQLHPNRQRFVVDRLSDELVLAERVASLAGERVHGPLIDLLLYGEEEDVERRAGAVVDEVVEQEGKPVGEHLLGDGLVAAQEDLGVAVLGLDGLLDEVGEEGEEHVGEVVHVVVEAEA